MKKIFLASAIAVFALTFSAPTQASYRNSIVTEREGGKHIPQSKVPNGIVSQFNSQFPNATNVQWQKEHEDGGVVYEVEFKVNGKRMKAEYPA